MAKTKIVIYGRKYTVNSEYDEKYIERLTYYVNNKLKDLTMKNQRLDYADACALCLLNVADDFSTESQEKIKVSEDLDELKKQYKELHEKLKTTEQKLSDIVKDKNKMEKTIMSKDNEIVKLKLMIEEAYDKKEHKRTDESTK